MTLSNYVVSFIDLLGQTERLLKYPLVPDIASPDDDLKRWLKSTFGRVEGFRDSFRDYLAAATKHEYTVAQLKGFRFHQIKIAPVSDSVVLYTSLYDEPDIVPMHDVHELFGACGSLFLLFLSQGIPFRGGIDVGVGMELPDLGFYGSAIPKAYYLESHVAEYPRVVVGSDMVECLQAATRQPGQDVKSKLVRKMAQDTLAMLMDDANGVHMIDFLHPYFRGLFAGEAASTFQSARTFVQSEIVRWQGPPANDKLLDRYRRLAHHFDDRRSEWLRDDDAEPA